MKKRVIRNLCRMGSPKASLVFFLCDYEDCEDNYQSLEQFLNKYSKDTLLSNIFGENCSYDFLRSKYYEFIYHKNNEMFIEAYQASTKYCFAINEDDFYLYSMCNSFSIKGKRVFEWSYPSGIFRMGKTRGETVEIIACNFKNLCTLRFYEKYVFGTEFSPMYERAIKKQDITDAIRKHYNWKLTNARFYRLSDSLGTLIDDYHVHLLALDNCIPKLDSLVYISDTWNATDDEILHDLTSISIMKYGTRYVAQWVAPL